MIIFCDQYVLLVQLACHVLHFDHALYVYWIINLNSHLDIPKTDYGGLQKWNVNLVHLRNSAVTGFLPSI